MMPAPAVLVTSIPTTPRRGDIPFTGTRLSYRMGQQGELLQEWAYGRTLGDSPHEVRFVSVTTPDRLVAANRVETTATDRALSRLRSFHKWNENWDGEGGPK